MHQLFHVQMLEVAILVRRAEIVVADLVRTWGAINIYFPINYSVSFLSKTLRHFKVAPVDIGAELASAVPPYFRPCWTYLGWGSSQSSSSSPKMAWWLCPQLKVRQLTKQIQVSALLLCGETEAISDATPLIGQILSFSKVAVTFEPMQCSNFGVLWDL